MIYWSWVGIHSNGSSECESLGIVSLRPYVWSTVVVGQSSGYQPGNCEASALMPSQKIQNSAESEQAGDRFKDI